MKKISYIIWLIAILAICNGCRHHQIVDDTPKDLTEVDFVKIDQIAALNAMQQNSVMVLNRKDLNYAIKYFQHFLEVVSLANVNAVTIKIDDLDELDVKNKKNEKFLEFVNLLSYYKINVIYEFDLDKLLIDFPASMTLEEEKDYSEELKEELLLLIEFLDSFDDKSKIASLAFSLKLPTIKELEKQDKANSLISRLGNNEYGFDRDNQKAYNEALRKIKFARKFFGLEQLIWRVKLDEITKGLADKLVARKNLDFEILTAVDMVIFQINYSNLNSPRYKSIFENGNISKSVILSLDIDKNLKWQPFLDNISAAIKSNVQTTSYGGMMLDNYGEFYQLWRGNESKQEGVK